MSAIPILRLIAVGRGRSLLATSTEGMQYFDDCVVEELELIDVRLRRRLRQPPKPTAQTLAASETARPNADANMTLWMHTSSDSEPEPTPSP